MNNGEGKGEIRTRYLWLLVLVVVLAIFGVGRLVIGSQQAVAPDAEMRPDLVLLEKTGSTGEAEKPPVTFKHGMHVTTLAQAGVEDVCLSCHRKDPDFGLSFVFDGIEVAASDDLRDAYHDKCFSCHTERDQGPTPEACGSCHQRQPNVAPIHAPASMDKSLHARHVAASQDKCEICHQGDSESGFRGVFGMVPGEDHPRPGDVYHAFCVNCHLEHSAQQKNTGPSDCAGCHDSGRQADWKKLDPVPRLKDKQPDRVFVAAAAADSGARMPVVAFDHMLHEDVSNDCRSCHHKTLKACNECHTIDGIPDGGGVTLAMAMHSETSPHSCIGCHEQRKAAADCAGCHAQLPDAGMDERYCASCHDGPMPGELDENAVPDSRIRHHGVVRFDPASIPETISLDRLVDKYEAASFPHGAIIQKLRENSDASPLAEVFHGDGDRICQGCHHHSPDNILPPKCGSCHGAAFENENMHVPGLNGAYHRQCLRCHEEMGLTTVCTDCHAERKVGQDMAAPRP